MRTAQAPLILLVDDDPSLRRAVGSVLKSGGFRVAYAETGEQAIDMVASEHPDLVALDLGLPGISGFETCRVLSSMSDVPILVLSVHDTEQDKIDALDLGADDYVTKPFSAGELLARIRALLRRSGSPSPVREVVVGDVTIDLHSQRVTREGEEIQLTRTEWLILRHLAENAGRIVPSRALIRAVWGPDADIDRQVLRVHVSNLRRKLEPDAPLPRHLVTEPGVGYRLVV